MNSEPKDNRAERSQKRRDRQDALSSEIAKIIARELRLARYARSRLQDDMAALPGAVLRWLRPRRPTMRSGATGHRKAFQRTFAWQSVKRSLLTTAFVGTIVNAINQGSDVLAGQGPVLWKLAFTYAVPFLVVSYGTFAAVLKLHDENTSGRCRAATLAKK